MSLLINSAAPSVMYQELIATHHKTSSAVDNNIKQRLVYGASMYYNTVLQCIHSSGHHTEAQASQPAGGVVS